MVKKYWMKINKGNFVWNIKFNFPITWKVIFPIIFKGITFQSGKESDSTFPIKLIVISILRARIIFSPIDNFQENYHFSACQTIS